MDAGAAPPAWAQGPGYIMYMAGTYTHTHTGATLLLPHNPQPSILDQTVLPFQTVASPRPRRPTLYHHTNSNSCQVCLPLSAPAPVPAPAPAPGKPTSRPIIEIHQHSIIIIDTHPPALSQPGWPLPNLAPLKTHTHTRTHTHTLAHTYTTPVPASIHACSDSPCLYYSRTRLHLAFLTSLPIQHPSRSLCPPIRLAPSSVPNIHTWAESRKDSIPPGHPLCASPTGPKKSIVAWG